MWVGLHLKKNLGTAFSFAQNRKVTCMHGAQISSDGKQTFKNRSNKINSSVRRTDK